MCIRDRFKCALRFSTVARKVREHTPPARPNEERARSVCVRVLCAALKRRSARSVAPPRS
eukprot:26597-Lingulodinium_polyedra.AAC.1